MAFVDEARQYGADAKWTKPPGVVHVKCDVARVYGAQQRETVEFSIYCTLELLTLKFHRGEKQFRFQFHFHDVAALALTNAVDDRPGELCLVFNEHEPEAFKGAREPRTVPCILAPASTCSLSSSSELPELSRIRVSH